MTNKSLLKNYIPIIIKFITNYKITIVKINHKRITNN